MTLHDLPDIAAGDVLGSCMLNIVIIALLDLKIGDKSLAVHNDCHRMLE